MSNTITSPRHGWTRFASVTAAATLALSVLGAAGPARAAVPGATISGQVTNSAGDPLKGIFVDASGPSGDVGILTDATGHYLIEGLDAGDYIVGFSDSAYGEYTEEFWDDAPSADLAAPVTVAQDGAVTAIDAVLAEAPAAPLDLVDASGTVTGPSGVGAFEIGVLAFDASAPADADPVDSAITNRKGQYRLENLVTGDYKLKFVDVGYDYLNGEQGTPYADEWSNDQRTWETATSLSVVEDGNTAVPDEQLARYSEIAATVTDSSGPVAVDPVEAYTTEDAPVATTGVLGADGVYRLFVEPGTYRLHFTATDYVTDPVNGVPYVSEWYGDKTSYSTSTPVTVGAGETKPVSVRMSKAIEAMTAPVVSGTPQVGSTLSASTGTWSLDGATYSYQWLRDGTAIDGATNNVWPLTTADVGHRLGVRVTASSDPFTGSALSAQTAAVGKLSAPPAPPASPAPVVKKVSSLSLAASSPRKGMARVVVTFKVAGLSGPSGKVTLKDGSKVKKTVSVLKGKAVVVLTRQKKGKHSYTAVYAGSSTVKGSTSAQRTLRVK